ncbi:uncharacterized protein LOC141664756 [Apium graveolens]|uniref:uncharacterized protein LOC141664756 n=1 Tax=Apium graveolens TaxID=4045 RepID=UPI003D7A8CFB
MIVEEFDPGTAGPTQVKELTAEVAADPSTHGDRELPKQPALKPKCLFPPPEVPPEDQSLSLKGTLQRDGKRKTVSDQHFRAKLERKREIHRLRREPQQTTVQNEEQDDEFYDEDDTEYEYEPSAESTYSQPRDRRQRTVSSAEVSRQTESIESISHEEFAKMQEEIAQMLTLMRNQAGFETVSESPLSLVLEKARIDMTLKTPTLDHFDGSSDPLAFLNTFDGRMAFFGHSEVARCQFFSTCLQGTTLRWYNNLPPRSIDSWAALKSKFQARFSSNYKGIKVTASLMTMHQRSGESLRSFLTRFREEIAEIPDLIEQMAVNFLTTGIDKSRHGLLLEEIFEKRPKTLQAEFQIIEHRMMLQEAVSCIQSPKRSSRYERRRNYSPRSSARDRCQERRRSPPGHTVEHQPRDRRERDWQPRSRPEKEFTKLNTEKMTILAVLKTEPDYRPPRPMKPGHPPSSRYCDYHEDTGHTTEQCFQLSNLIEGKIRRGQLVHYVQREDSPRRHRRVEEDRVIDVIFGGVAAGGLSYNSRKSYAREVFNVNPPTSKRTRANSSPVISFSDDDYRPGLIEVHQDALVITTRVGNNMVKKMLVDNGSSVDVLYHHAFSRMDLGDRRLENARTPLYGFTGNEVHVVGTVDMPVLFGSPAILGRTTITALRAITSISHLKMKFPTDFGVGEMVGDQATARQCYLTTVSPRKRTDEELEVNQVLAIDPRELIDKSTSNSCSPLEETEDIEVFEGNSNKTTRIGKNLSSDLKKEITNLIREFSDIFVWVPKDMPGIPEAVARHSLHINKDTRPVRQKQRIFSAEERAAIDQEVERLLDAGFIEPVQFPTWISNVVLVKKSNGKWRMCIDYSDVNRACPKDFYPLPNIDQLIDATAGNELLSFMDAFSGYNQIKMDSHDWQQTAFITHRGVFGYKVMSFGLINAGATFQQTMDKLFSSQIGRNMLIYVDDMITKSKVASDHVTDLRETFTNIRANNMRLNPAKCSFGLTASKFLGFLVTQKGIEADPAQAKAILEMSKPRSIKDLQKLTGCIAALRRFIPQSSKRCLPFFSAMKKASKSSQFEWNEDCEKNFMKLKIFLKNPPVLTRPLTGEPLRVYLSASDETVATVLVRVDEGKNIPVYYISHSLRDAETRYPQVEKLVYALVVASRKLRHYFQAREIHVLTNLPLKRILHKPDITGRLAAWTIELSQFYIEYKPRTAIKAQVLSDFVTECQFKSKAHKPEDDQSRLWLLFIDGSSTSNSEGAGVILISPEGFKIQQALKFGFSATNNVAEYEVLIAGLKLASDLEAEVIDIFGDSQLVSKQISGEFKTHNERMARYLTRTQELLNKFSSWKMSNVDREENQWADSLAKLASSNLPTNLSPTYVDVLETPSIDEVSVNQIQARLDWRQPFLEYIIDNKLPEHKTESRTLIFKARNYCVVGSVLYRRALSEPLLCCLSPEEALQAIVEIHTGICGEHLGGKTLALKIIRQGLFWPTIRKDCEDYVKKCQACQLHGNVNRRPTTELNSILSPCPFFQWGIDIVGPFPKSKNQCQYIIVAVDYATKWVEAKPLAKI